MSARSLVRLCISAAVLLVFVLHGGRWLPLRLLDLIENFTYDARVVLTAPGTDDPRVVIVDLDERSLADRRKALSSGSANTMSRPSARTP